MEVSEECNSNDIVDDNDEEDPENKMIKNVFKSNKREYRKNNEIVLELQPRLRWGKCVGASKNISLRYTSEHLSSKPPSTAKSYNYIPCEIWELLANYVVPEDVKTFALICRQSAYAITSCSFWKQLHKRYCNSIDDSKNEGKSWPRDILRRRTIRCLFVCYKPFWHRISNGYKFDILRGKNLKNQFVRSCSHSWVIWYEFQTRFPYNSMRDPKIIKPLNKDTETNPVGTVDSWEDLFVDGTSDNVDDDSAESCANNSSQVSIYSTANKVPHEEGTYLLVIRSTIFDFKNSAFESYMEEGEFLRLENIRETIATDMRTLNLELSFTAIRERQQRVINHRNICNYEIVPWYHPKYKSMCESQCKVNSA